MDSFEARRVEIVEHLENLILEWRRAGTEANSRIALAPLIVHYEKSHRELTGADYNWRGDWDNKAMAEIMTSKPPVNGYPLGQTGENYFG